jgi:hypothetical protein
MAGVWAKRSGRICQPQLTRQVNNELPASIGPVVVDEALAKTFLDCLTNLKFVPTLGTTDSLKRFKGLLHNRWYNTRESIGRIEELESDTQKLIDRLEARLSTFDRT